MCQTGSQMLFGSGHQFGSISPDIQDDTVDREAEIVLFTGSCEDNTGEILKISPVRNNYSVG